MTPQELRGLLGLAEAREARELARHEALVAADRRLAAEIDDLSGVHRRDLAEAATQDAPPALLGRRLVWADRRTAELRARRAALAPEIAAARAAAAQSVGRREVLSKLLEKALRAARAARDARAERDAPPRA